MSHRSLSPEQFEALLDARPGQPGADELKKHIAADEGLAETAQLQAAINRSLRTGFECPSPNKVLAAVKAASVRQPTVRSAKRPLLPRLGRWSAIAACIALLIFAGYHFFDSGILGKSARDQIVRHKKRPVPKYDGPSVIAAHQSLLDSGYRPTQPLTDKRAIASTIWRRTGQGLIPSAAMPSNSRILGMSEVHCLSPNTLALMLEVEGKPLTVLIDKLENDRFICVERPMEITPFRHQVGSLVLYEVTPHGRPIVCECFVDPQQSKEWYENGGGF